MKLWSTAVAVLILGIAAHMAWAGDGCCCQCQGCGCQCECRKVTCRIVCEMKKEKYYFYVCEGECFCLPGPGHQVPACGGCGQCGGEGCGGAPCGCMPKDCHKHQTHCIWQPSCCHMHHKKVLKKYECEKEIPCYKCVVVDLCPGCCAHMHSCGAAVEEGAAPAGPAKVPVPPSAQADPGPGAPRADAATQQTLLEVLGFRAQR